MVTCLDKLKAVLFGHVWTVVGIEETHWINAARAADVNALADHHAAQWDHVDLAAFHLVPAGHYHRRHESISVIVNNTH